MPQTDEIIAFIVRDAPRPDEKQLIARIPKLAKRSDGKKHQRSIGRP